MRSSPRAPFRIPRKRRGGLSVTMETTGRLPGRLTMARDSFWLLYKLLALVVPHGFVAMATTLSARAEGQLGASVVGDPRMTTFEDLSSDNSVAIFYEQSIMDYSYLVIDIPRQQVILGARNHLVRLAMKTLKPLEITEWRPDKLTIKMCQAKGQDPEDCQNYIRVLVQVNDTVLACGTFAFSPKCSWRKVSSLEDVLSYLPGLAKCPYDPRQNSTALLSSDGNLYSATVTDFTARDPAIFRTLGPAKHLRTVQYNSRWLNEPDFVSSHEIGEFVYFFFRESAIEYINCGKNIYSRVARVCKNDNGGSNFLLEDNWTTFVKARLNCSLPGRYPFYFNELQNTYFVKEQGLIYAIFTTSPTSIYGTAVCVYNLTAFDSAFSGAFKYQENMQKVWTRVSNTGSHQCHHRADMRSATETNQTPAQRKLIDAMKFQIMDSAVQPLFAEPLLVAENERFTHVVVDVISTKHHQAFTVIFVATLEGLVKKYMLLPGTRKLCLIEEIQVVPPGSKPGLLKTMKLEKNDAVLYVGTQNRVYKIPLQRCHRYTSRSSCIRAQDPYCAWSSEKKECSRLSASLPAHFWHQNVTSCPTKLVPGLRGWSDWSNWQNCEHSDAKSGSLSPCLCRHRMCYASSDDLDCSGSSVQITNCTVHGSWTTWSSWSSCSSTCGIAVRARHRFCGNPEPQFGGRICVGPNVDEAYCLENPDCPVSTVAPVDGQWSAWSAWSVCTRLCGGGIQTRERVCSSPIPQYGGMPCIGNNAEWRQCNIHECGERKRTEWSEWQAVNTTKTGTVQERIRFTCRAPVEDEHDIRISHIKRDMRFCPLGGAGEDCKKREPELMRPEWSPWSEWTMCNRLCDSGTQSRRRLCVPSSNSCACEGHSQEIRICNTHSCQGHWSCWSDYSTCSATCGLGRRYRKRQCQATASDGHYTQPCPGSDREEIPCTDLPSCTTDCSGVEGWTEWSHWSLCRPENTRERQRLCCNQDSIYSQCVGPRRETRICKYNEIPQIGIQAAAQGDSSDTKVNVQTASVQEVPVQSIPAVHVSCRECFCMYHLIIVGIVGFILGGVICVGIFLYCQRQQQENKEQDKYNMLQRLHQTTDSFKNEYVSPTDVSPQVQSNIDLVPLASNNQYYSSGSLKHKDSYRSLTVREASLKRDSLLRTNSMRTNLSLNNMEY